MEKIKLPALAILMLCLVSGAFAAGLKGKVDAGNGLYNKGSFDGALSKYQDAQIDEPENPVLHFNSGDAHYKMEKYEEAVKEYEKASYSKDIGLQAKSYYNIGNSLYKSGKMPEAIQYYQKCLELNPKDQDAKYNIEFVRKKIKEQIDKNKQEGKEGQDKKENKQEQKSKEGKDNKDKKEQKQQQAKEAKENKDNKDRKDKKEGEEKKDKMSREDAERILKAINEDEKRSLDKKKENQMKNYQWGSVQEDW